MASASVVSLSRVGLEIETVLSKGCSKITVEDVTGAYNVTSNPLGYGMPNGILQNDINTIVINLYYPDITTPITYTFTLSKASGSLVVTALTVTDLNGVVYNIISELSVLYVNNIFDLTGTEAFTLPTITDGIFSIDFTISGIDSITSQSFEYTTSSDFLSSCNADCCIMEMYKNLDMCCDCSEEEIKRIQKAETFLMGAKCAINIGQDEKSLCLLNKAKEICDGNCSNC
jgi:hypothetical protein